MNVDHRQHRGGLGPVALKSLSRQWESGRIREQTDGDLRVEAAFFRESRPPEPVIGISFEVQRAHVVEHQRRRAQPRVAGARRRQRLPEGVFGERGQRARNGPVGHRFDTGLGQHPQRALLAGRLLASTDAWNTSSPPAARSNPSTSWARHKASHRCPARDLTRSPQPARVPDQIQTEVELALTADQPLPGRGLQRLHRRPVMSRTHVLDAARTPPGGPHDVHRGRP